MEIPKGNIIKFWLDGQETFNQKVVKGIDSRVFNQRFNNSDTVAIQIQDTAIVGYTLRVLDVDGISLVEYSFTYELVNDVYIYSINGQIFSGLPNGTYSLDIVTIENRIQASIAEAQPTLSSTVMFALAFTIDTTITDAQPTLSSTISTGASTSVLNWQLQSGSSSNGRLQILINGLEVVDETTTTSLVSGSEPIVDGDEIEVINYWISGSGNTSRCRVCDSNTPELDYSEAIISDSPKTFTFIFNYATHGAINVNLRSGGLTPDECVAA